MPRVRTKTYYLREYVEKQRSPADIANEHNTYPNKIRREIKSFHIPLRDKSEAQKVAIEQGRHEHPTKGKVRETDVRHKISASMAKVWDEMTDDERKRRADIGKEQWNSTPKPKRDEFKRLAAKAVRDASENGSKLEQFIRDGLINAGYAVEFHTVIHDEKIDLYLKRQGIVIDIHGPTHFIPIWGEDYLDRRRAEDDRKIRRLTKKGLLFIRVVHAAKSIAEVDKIVLFERILHVVVGHPQPKVTFIQLEVN